MNSAVQKTYENLDLGIVEINNIAIGDGEMIFDIGGVAGADLRVDNPTLPECATFSSLGVHEEIAGNGLARVLFEHAVTEAKRKGCLYLSAIAANERTAALFSRFPADRLTFDYIDNITGEYTPLVDHTLEDTIGLLRAYRKLWHPNQERPDAQLDIGIEITARL